MKKTAKSTNKKDLISSIAVFSGLSKTSSALALDALVLSIKKTLKDGNVVSITGLGSFSVRHKPPRTRRNPQTGQSVKLKASKHPKFKASQALRNAIS